MPTPYFADLARELCQDGGTGPLTPTGAVPGHRRLADAVPVDTPFHYAVAGIARPEQWEVGWGRIDDSGRLVRDTVMASSQGVERVDFAAGLKTVALTVAADWFEGIDAAIAAQDGAVSAVVDALGGKQPLSTLHAAAAAGAVGDAVTVRRGDSWVNIPLATLAFRSAEGRYVLDGEIGAPNGNAAAPSISFAADSDTGLFRAGADSIGLATGGGERMRVTDAGRIGIGTSDPSAAVHVSGTSPNLRIGQTAAVDTFYGVELFAGGFVDGSFKSSLTSGEVRICAGRSVGWGGFLAFHTDTVERLRLSSNGTLTPGADNVQALGAAGKRWSTVFAATGTINTSDAREKTWRGAANEAEMRAARRIAAELGFFQWNQAIADKGPGAREHFGARAQSAWSIMAEEGLIDPIGEDAPPDSRYAFLCHDRIEQADGGVEDRFGLREGQLCLFLIAAQEARIAALEAAI